MIRRKISLSEAAAYAAQTLPKGILLTTKAEGKVNSMVIGWGVIGRNWSNPAFAVFVREGRFTREQLDKNPEFTVNIPLGDDFDKKILAICGNESGRNVDKIAKAGLTLVDPEVISVPAIKEFPLTLECKVVYRQPQELSLYPDAFMGTLYPQDVDSSAPGCNKDPHVTYFGEIVAAYIAE